MNVLILGFFLDEQTGMYVARSFALENHPVCGVDIREAIRIHGNVEAQEEILKRSKMETDHLKGDVDLILILKGAELTKDTLKKLKEQYPKAKLVNWFFDKYMGDKPIWENEQYLDTFELYDYYFCSLKGVADKLNEAGYDNAVYLDEACHPEKNGEIYLNNFQKKKYCSDVVFIGSIGYSLFHPERLPVLEKIGKEGFDLKIWGMDPPDWKMIPSILKACHTGEPAINQQHSAIANSSLINIGVDQDPSLELSHSARLYRVMCAGGLYLTSYVKGLENMFKINGDGEEITSDQELVVYYNKDDLIRKLDFLLENDDIREQIALNGQKVVLEKHTFQDRVKEMVEILKKRGK